MNTGAPMPAVHSDERGLLCAYYTSEKTDSRAVVILRFEVVLHFSLGYPNDEALGGHPLHGFGLSCYAAYTVDNSPLLAQFEDQNRIHRAYKPGMYADFRHWIITFHDDTLEVLARRALVIGYTHLSPDKAVCVA
jgi:hypothetical protein